MPSGYVHDRIHLTGNTRIVDGDDRPRSVRHCLFDQRLVNIHGVRPDVDKNCPGSAENKGIRGGYKCVRRHDHLIALPDIDQERCKLCRLRAGGRQQAFCHACILLDPLTALLRERTVPAYLLVLDCLSDVCHLPARKGRYVKIDHALSTPFCFLCVILSLLFMENISRFIVLF